MSSKWLAAFKEIHGKTPTKADYELAPKHIREELLGSTDEKETNESAKEGNIKKNIVKLKRPADDQISPFKPRPKRKLLDLAATPTRREANSRVSATRKIELEIRPSHPIVRISPRKHLTRVDSNVFDTPEKEKYSKNEVEKCSTLPSEEKPSSSQENSACFSPKRSIRIMNSPFATPEKFKISTLTDEDEILRTPIRSPQKPFKNTIRITNVAALFAPSPEKKVVREEEEVNAFEAEDCKEKTKTQKNRLPAKGVAKVFDPTTGRIIARPFKRNEETEPAKPKKKTPKEKGNFIRINMKKKNFTRGKPSAEAKRKLRKKQLWKKRFGSKT